ncbi:fumarylacetoacetate hydrolase [Curvibacter sp. CHRR-16]|uniref:fumarylacetoacetate hydrolase n=1 Tax=Curvibacter sp. CHRR-16 TaxID=2835872 RepID=UPI001BDAEFF7|nr:fumarylacetoacetate hydrolase [Curvibacter sp. CHRR-16]MBT0569833.1 fumarylacetoacetate hydrolase [Curvibacter sp. CHRR-16]
MKLATLHDGSRDGQLVVVSRDGTHAHYATHIAQRLQQVLDDWNYLSPLLQDVYVSLNQGRARHAFAFDASQCLAPLPRAYQCLQASADGVLQHPSDDLGRPDAELAGTLACSAHVGVLCGDVPMACTADRAQDAVRLLVLAQHTRWVVDGQQHSHGWQLAPLAITPDELGEAWQRGRAQVAVHASLNGHKPKAVAGHSGGSGNAGVGYWLASAARWRRLRAGTLLALPALTESDWTLQSGDSLRWQAVGADGGSPWGALELHVSG